ncbi:MAG: phage tail protein, partial [Sphingobium sp.]
MATVVLTAVGSVFGPIGAAIGALAGQAIDAAIFAPVGREGPRIVDLRVQTSSFGTQIPRLFGKMRVAGTVIWATDLIESTQTSGGGKGKPSVTTYTYSASFAVALSSRPIARIGRIWADGNLLRGNAGDFKSGVGAFRVHKGAAGQQIDPLIAADRGVDRSPAHRGLAYAVFEGLNLADFGNRIPSLTFEIFSDEGDVSVAAIAADVTDGLSTAVAGDSDVPAVAGYAAGGENAGNALQPLLDGYALLVRPIGEAVALTASVPQNLVHRAEDDIVVARGEALPGRTIERAPVESAPRRLSVRHYDPARDYQAGTQSAERPGGMGQKEMQVDLPATLGAVDAQGRAADLLRRQLLGRRRVAIARGWDALLLAPGDVIAVEQQGGGWRVETVEWEGMAVKLALSAVPTRPVSLPGTADGGSAVLQRDKIVGPTSLMIVETPQLRDGLVHAPQLFVAASGRDRGWRGAAILLEDEAGGYSPIGSIRRGAAMGVTRTVLAAGTARMFDSQSTVDIELYDADAVLVPASDAMLLNGANACMIEQELVQFGTVTPLGGQQYRLGRLLRGRRGTEVQMAGHAIGQAFLLLDAETLLPFPEDQAVGR